MSKIIDAVKKIKKHTGLKNIITDISGIELGAEQKKVFDLLENTNDNIFVTGKAGTGKSVLLQYFVKNTKKTVAVVAPTGVAALNVGGETIHSFFVMDIIVQQPEDLEAVSEMGYTRKKIMQKLDTLVIDEISMVRADVMDMIDAKLRYARKSKLPFGGCQIVCFGDLYQLPPVGETGDAKVYMKERYGTELFFGAPAIRENPFTIVELGRVFRQKDTSFVDILNRIRLGDRSQEILNTLNDNCLVGPENDEYITLTDRNATADAINRMKLAELPGEEFVYEGSHTGSMSQNIMPTDEKLRLKVGALVMMVKNDIPDPIGKRRWVNGSLGTITKLSDDEIEVKINGHKYPIDIATWERYKYTLNRESKDLEKEVVATFTQYPIKLAYAITIHKSQGQTYDAVKIDLSHGAFAEGQTYVALSRCRSMDSLYLETPLKPRDIIVNREVREYMADKVVMK